MEENEVVWKDVPGYENIYQVSSNGVVRSLDRKIHYSNGSYRLHFGKILKQKENEDGYFVVHLRNKENQSWPSVHTLVAKAFISNEKLAPTVNHKDGNKKNNSVSNLEWASYSEQTRHAYDNGLIIPRGHTLYSKKLKAEMKKYWDENNLSIREFARHFNISECTAKKISVGKWGYPGELTDEEKEKALNLRKSGMTLKATAEAIGSSISTIHRLTKVICDE